MTVEAHATAIDMSSARIGANVSEREVSELPVNGRQMSDAARRRRPDLKVLFMTGYAENLAARANVLEPGTALITKPFRLEELAERVKAMIAG